MKKNRLVLLLSMLFLSFAIYAQSDIGNALGQGDINAIVAQCNENIELSIKGVNNIYSKQQAIGILNDFFSKNKPQNFQQIHSSTKNNAQFIIGTLTTSSGVFRVSFLTKDNQIQQLRIEKQ